ncbi:carboxylesterase [Parafrankia irregularis]|uniref:Carboxylesterase n=1 Tax=Parafrankia irregularis TaxID=795642 RepID=A0A0S4R0M7_9ACTN|nr:MULTISPECIES: alpha/beta fold hydrolase [Parafrankia]MBE3206379.1 alpha/beta fold hydrolase [Parafrankia sp. CH37]CUU60422.1 carboxylesterase [Parafrankia irregularis]
MAGVPESAVLPGAEPFDLRGAGTADAGAGPGAAGGDGGTGVLLVHGFTGSPHSMRPWGEHLAAAGLRVSCPRLPGHGTRWQDMARTTWQDWFGAADEAFGELSRTCERVFVMGLSMGGTLTLRLAEVHGARVAGAVTVNASLGTDRRIAVLAPLLWRVMPTVPGVAGDIRASGVREVGYARVPTRAFASLRELWAVTRADLGRIVCPVVAYRSVVDHVVEPTSGRLLLEGITSAPVEERLLHDSYHVATLDNDKETIFKGSVEFVTTQPEAAAR